MRKRSKRILGSLLAIVMCLSLLPMAAFAAPATGTDAIPQAEDTEAGAPAATPDETLAAPEDGSPSDEPTVTPGVDEPVANGPSDEVPSVPDEPADTPEPSTEPTEPAEEEPAAEQEAPATQLTPVEPELLKVVSRPLVQVVYHYFDEAQSQDVTDFAGYAVSSSHTYYAIAMADGASITIAANQYPDSVPVSTDALRFRVLLNGSEDITVLAAYDPATGLVSLPYDYMGHAITVEWYCPASEVTELTIQATVSVYANGAFTERSHTLTLPSNADEAAIPLTYGRNPVVSQNGIELDAGVYRIADGVLYVSASPLGGGLAVTAYAPTPQLRFSWGGGGDSAGVRPTQVTHTRSADQIYYGYYTSYYTANGNTALCLDPTVSGLNAGTYDISYWVDSSSLLAKCAYYFYGGPGYDSVKYRMFDQPDTMAAYGLCHAAAAYVYLGSMDAFKGLSSDMSSQLINLVNFVNALSAPPSGFEAFVYNAGSSTNQCLLGWWYDASTPEPSPEPEPEPEPDPLGDVEIVKTSGNTAMSEGNSCYSLAGAVFDVYNSSGQTVGSITTDANGYGKLTGLPVGSGYYLAERTPPQGFAATSQRFSFSISANQTATVNVSNIPQNDPAAILLKKQDADTQAASPQGGATLAGAEFTVRYYKGLYSSAAQLSGVTPARTWVFRTGADGTIYFQEDYLVSGDAFYYTSSGAPTLPLGTVAIQETKAPEGYLLNSEVFIRQITPEGSAETVQTYSEAVVPDQVIRGGVEIEKWDMERDAAGLKQGDAALEGAVFEIYNRNGNSVVVGGAAYAPGEVVYTMTTDANGRAGTAADLLPYGQWEIVEKTPPTGMLNTGVIRQAFSITEDGVTVSLTASDTVMKNDVIRGSVLVEKWDNETGEHRAQGGATLAGAVFEIVNQSADSVLVEGVLYAPGEVVYTMTTDETGAAQTPEYLLPYGTYVCREVSPPSHGYLATGVLSRTFTIREHGVAVLLNTADTAIKNDPIRGDLKGIKISDGDAKRLANVPFRITSVTTGESHVIVTDVNGEFSTASDWNPHSQNTNRGETDRDGVWFGEPWTLNDDVGALLYDTYTIEELPCEANEGYELLTFEVSVYRHNTVIDLGTLTDDRIVTPEIFTTARDQQTDTNSAYAAEQATILDTVYYSGLKADEEYTLKGALMDKETGEPLLIGDAAVTAETTFRAPAESGSVTMAFTFDSTALRGKSVVVFESLEYEGEEIAAHADIADEYQTITFLEPAIGTSAAGADGEKDLDVAAQVTLIDTVSYANLIVGESYTLKGVLMDKETGEPLLIGGETVTAETTFEPDAPSGSAEVVFTFDSTALKGKTVVVFETLAHAGAVIATHADIADEGQTVTFKTPRIGTSASAEGGGKTVPISASVTVVDTVAYENLVPNKAYVLKGVLMDKESGLPLMKDGTPVTAQTEFTPSASSGSVEVRFTVDTRAIGGRTLVVFESLEQDGKEIAVHADIDDAAQCVTVAVPEPVDEPKPTEPVKPVPQTGDDYLLVLWLTLSAAAFVGIAVCVMFLCKKKRKAVIPLILFAILLAMGAYMALDELKQYGQAADAYAGSEQFLTLPEPDGQEETPEVVYIEIAEEEDAAGEAEEPAPPSTLPAVDFTALQAVNPDIVGWLMSEGTPINYPVAQGENNRRYLNQLYDGSQGKAGTPFLDFENSADFTDRNSIVYGHNLLDGSMFASLTEYGKQAYYDAHPDMLLLTPAGAWRMEVFAAFTASPDEAGSDTSPWRQSWSSDDAFAAWLEQAVNRSVIDTDITPTQADRVLTLSTCTSRGRSRFILMGRLVPAE